MIETLTTRFKDLIMLTSGKKIYPEEIEEVYEKVAPSDMRGCQKSAYRAKG